MDNNDGWEGALRNLRVWGDGDREKEARADISEITDDFNSHIEGDRTAVRFSELRAALDNEQGTARKLANHLDEVGAGSQFDAQAANMDVDRARIAGVTISPHAG